MAVLVRKYILQATINLLEDGTIEIECIAADDRAANVDVYPDGSTFVDYFPVREPGYTGNSDTESHDGPQLPETASLFDGLVKIVELLGDTNSEPAGGWSSAIDGGDQEL